MSALTCEACDGRGCRSYSAELSSGASGTTEIAACWDCHGTGALPCVCCANPATQLSDGEGLCESCAQSVAADAERDLDVTADTLPAMRATLGARECNADEGHPCTAGSPEDDDGIPCAACAAYDAEMMRQTAAAWAVASPEERDPERYRRDMIECGRGRLVGAE
jgi:hypothetical protein